ncbi:MAG: hypothetical protein ABL955_00910 [Elusimicrobiota bacterium]
MSSLAPTQAAPLDALHNNLSTQDADPRQANLALADRLDTVDRYMADVLRLCADRSIICNKRFCAMCARARSTRLATRYKVRLERMIRPHHLTLTSFPAEFLTRPALDEVRARFKLLRRRASAEPKINITGGVGNVEIDVDESGRRWLIGLHAVIDAPGAPSENWLREAWQDLGGGQQVRLDAIVRGTATQTFAYSTKPATLPSRFDMLRAFIVATKGFRATMPFGNVHPLHGRRPGRRAPETAR